MEVTLRIQNLTKYFDGTCALKDFSYDFYPSRIYGIVGPNGAGKTTLFNLISGFISADKGHVYVLDEGIKKTPPHLIARKWISRTFQEMRVIKELSVLGNVMLGFKKQPGENLFYSFFRPFKSRKIEHELKKRAFKFLVESGIEDLYQKKAGDLSYGQQKLLAIACYLSLDGIIYLLDEPFSGISQNQIKKIMNIIQYLRKEKKTIILIEHNFQAVEKICDKVLFLDEGKLLISGTPDEVKNNSQVMEAYLD